MAGRYAEQHQARRAFISGHVTLRPVRLGLVIATESPAELTRAIQLASVCWGGRTFPIFLADEEPDAVMRTAALLGVDAIVPCSDDPELVAWSNLLGFQWAPFGGSPLNFADFGNRPVNVAKVLEAWAAPPPATSGLVEWDRADDLDPLFHVMFGKIDQAASAYEGYIHGQVSNLYATARIGPGAIEGDDAPQPWSGPLSIGMYEVAWTGWTHHGGLAVIDPHSVRDLVALWNLRAIGPLVLPWPEPWDERIGAFTENHLELARRKDRPHDFFDLEVFAKYPGPEVPSRLRAVLGDEHSFGVGPLDLSHLSHLGSGISTHMRRSFEASVEVMRGAVQPMRVPLPPVKETRPSRDEEYVPQAAIASIDVFSEEGLPEGITFAPPPLRALQPELRWTVNVAADVVRATSDGPALSVEWGAQEVSVGPVMAESLCHRLLERAGFVAEASDAGLWSGRILEILGGSRSFLTAQPAVRETLEKCARASGANTEELRGAIHRLGGSWKDHHEKWRPRGLSYPDAVLTELGARRAIEGRLAFTCRSCGLGQQAPADEITDLVICADCDAQSALVAEIIHGAHWRLKTRSLLTATRLRSVFPIGAALALLGQYGGGLRTRGVPYALGVNLERGDESFEIDFAVFVIDERGPALIIGEAKSGRRLDEADIRNLTTLQDAVRALGVECYIAFAYSRERLSADEVTLLRSAAERGLATIGPDRGRGGQLNLPLCLSQAMLTQPPDDDSHPFRSTHPTRWSVGALAYWTCEVALGLTGSTVFGRQLTWTDIPTS